MRFAPLLLLLSACTGTPDTSARDASSDAGFIIPEAGAKDAEAADAADAGEDPHDSGEQADSGPADAGSDCTFAAVSTAHLDPRDTLPAAEIDRLSRCAVERPADAPAFVDAFLAALAAHGGGAPYQDGEALIFFRGDAARVTVSGSFDAWPSPGQRSFTAIAGTDLSVARIPMVATARHQYKLTRRAFDDTVEWSTDPLNPWVTWDGIDHAGVGEFNNELFGAAHDFTASALHRSFIRDRDVFLQLPAAHFSAAPPELGVLYVSDGNETLTRSGMQAVVDETILDGRAPPLAVVYVALPTQEARFDEYTYGSPTANGDAYVAMLADEIAPQVERFFRTAPLPDQRGISGASLGGLIAFHAAFSRPDAFRLIGAQSASLFWNEEELIDRVDAAPLQPIRIYLDSGSPGDNVEVNQRMADVLTARGYDHLHVIEPGAAHDWAFWAGRFDELLEFLY